MGILLGVLSCSLDTSSSKPHLLQRRVNWDLPVLFAGLPDSSLSDDPDFHISGRVLDKWVCLYQSLGIGVKHPLSWGGSIWHRLQRFSLSAYISWAIKGFSNWSFSICGEVHLVAHLLGAGPAYCTFGSLGSLSSRLQCGGTVLPSPHHGGNSATSPTLFPHSPSVTVYSRGPLPILAVVTPVPPSPPGTLGEAPNGVSLDC